MTESKGLAAIKITSLIRPALLLKFSTLVSAIDKHNQTNPMDQIDSDIFKWSELLSKQDDSFASSLNNIKQLSQASCVAPFTPNELGELRNMFLRLDELGNVNVF